MSDVITENTLITAENKESIILNEAIHLLMEINDMFIAVGTTSHLNAVYQEKIAEFLSKYNIN